MDIAKLTATVKLRRGAWPLLVVINCARHLCGLPIWVPLWAFSIRIERHAPQERQFRG